MIEIIVIFLLFVFFVLASYEDIKKREVYDYLNFSLVFIMLIIAIFDSFVSFSFDPIKFSIFGLLVAFALGSFLYYMGIWGGGDAKFLLGFGASSHYILEYIGSFDYIVNLYTGFSLFYGNVLDLTLNYFLWFILFLDGIFLLFILISLFFTKPDKSRTKDLALLFLILFLLFSGIYFNLVPLLLVILGFIAFLLIFFGDEMLFRSVFLVVNKPFKKIKKSDVFHEDFKFESFTLKQKETNFGLSLEKYNLIKDLNLKKTISIRKIIPYSSLIGLNYFLYTIKIVSINSFTFELFYLILLFLFISFMVGGIFSILLILFAYLYNFRKITLNFKKLEIFTIFLSFIFLLFLVFYFKLRFFILVFPLIYVFVKIAKKTEIFLFVKKKPIKKIVPGDWIFEDVKINNKIYFSKDDFKLGVNEEQLEKIKELADKYTAFKFLLVKDGIAFLPPLFASFLLILFFL